MKHSEKLLLLHTIGSLYLIACGAIGFYGMTALIKLSLLNYKSSYLQWTSSINLGLNDTQNLQLHKALDQFTLNNKTALLKSLFILFAMIIAAHILHKAFCKVAIKHDQEDRAEVVEDANNNDDKKKPRLMYSILSLIANVSAISIAYTIPMIVLSSRLCRNLSYLSLTTKEILNASHFYDLKIIQSIDLNSHQLEIIENQVPYIKLGIVFLALCIALCMIYIHCVGGPTAQEQLNNANNIIKNEMGIDLLQGVSDLASKVELSIKEKIECFCDFISNTKNSIKNHLHDCFVCEHTNCKSKTCK